MNEFWHGTGYLPWMPVVRPQGCPTAERAVCWHSENHVLLNGRHTVVFR
jgi:hypothetical protein